MNCPELFETYGIASACQFLRENGPGDLQYVCLRTGDSAQCYAPEDGGFDRFCCAMFVPESYPWAALCAEAQREVESLCSSATPEVEAFSLMQILMKIIRLRQNLNPPHGSEEWSVVLPNNTILVWDSGICRLIDGDAEDLLPFVGGV